MTCLVSSESRRNNLSYSVVNEGPQLSQKARGPSVYTKPYSSPVVSQKFGIPAAIFENITMQLCDARWPGVRGRNPAKPAIFTRDHAEKNDP